MKWQGEVKEGTGTVYNAPTRQNIACTAAYTCLARVYTATESTCTKRTLVLVGNKQQGRRTYLQPYIKSFAVS